MAVAIPKGASVLEPVVPGPARYMVSEVIAIVTVAPEPATKTIVAPTGIAIVALAGIVTVRVALE